MELQVGQGGGGEGAPVTSVRQRAITGSIWMFAGFGYGQGVRLAGNIALAFLFRDNMEAIGIMALVNSLNTGLQMTSDVGLNMSVVQHERGEDRTFLNTAWTLQVIRGVLLFVVCCVVGVPYAMFFEEPVLGWLVPATGLVLILVAVQSPGVLIAERRIEVWRKILLDVVAQTVTLGTMLAWALLSPTVWAMAAGVVVGGGARAISSYWLAPAAAPRLRLEREACRAMLGFGGWLLVATMLTYFATELPTLSLGKAFGKAELAVFAVAYMLATFSSQAVARLSRHVVFPVFAAVKNRGGDIAEAAERMQRPLRVFAGVATAAVYAAGPSIVLMLYPHEYADAAWMVRLLAITSILVVLGESLKMSLLSLGHARSAVWGQGAKLAALAALLPLGSMLTTRTMSWALPGFVAAAALAEGARYMAFAIMTREHGIKLLGGDAVWIGFTGVVGVVGALLADSAAGWALVRFTSGVAASDGHAMSLATRGAAGVGVAVGGTIAFAAFALPLVRAFREVHGGRRDG